MHPRLKDGVSMGTFSYAGQTQEHYYVENEKGKMFEVSYSLYCELWGADGTHPLRVTKRVLNRLKRREIITTSRWQFEGVCGRFTLFPVGCRVKKFKPLCRILNRMLPFAALLVFLSSLILKKGGYLLNTEDIHYLLFFVFVLISSVLHETGHLIAAISYDQEISEIGLSLIGPFLTGAYVARIANNRLSQRQAIQLYLAGVEMNLLYSGILLFMSVVNNTYANTFHLLSGVNIFQIFINLLPANSLDGYFALGVLLGIEDLNGSSKRFLSSKKYRHQIFHMGTKGYFYAVLFLVCRISNAVVKILVLFDFLCISIFILSCFL